MNDLISRQAALIKRFESALLEHKDGSFILCTPKFVSMAVEILKALKAWQWIPCSERLPEEEGWYLVTIQNDKTRKRRTENDLFAIGIAEAHKHTPYKFCKDGHRQTVIAWMSIPEPYKAESEEV